MELIKKTKKELERQNKPYAEWYSEEEAILHEGKVPYISFSSCDQYDWLKLAFSTRRGGVSSGSLSSMNLGWDKAVDRGNVAINYKIICERLGIDYQRLVFSDQVHGSRVAYVDEKLCAGEDMKKRVWRTDAIMTDVPNVVLATSYADCTPIFLIDTKTHLIASVHAGWKGTVAQIVQKTLEEMFGRGSQAEDIMAVIGPSICQECYDVGKDVVEAFEKIYSEEECSHIMRSVYWNKGGKKHLDLWAANWFQLIQSGVRPENIHISGVCTCCNHALLYSHRYANGKRGSLNGFLMTR